MLEKDLHVLRKNTYVVKEVDVFKTDKSGNASNSRDSISLANCSII